MGPAEVVAYLLWTLVVIAAWVMLGVIVVSHVQRRRRRRSRAWVIVAATPAMYQDLACRHLPVERAFGVDCGRCGTVLHRYRKALPR